MQRKPAREVPAQKFSEQFKALRQEILDRIEDVCLRGHFILGPELKTLESDFAKWLGARHAAGCASGTDALYLALAALGVGPGDEVITSPFTFFATASAIVRTGARPVFADIDPLSYNLAPEKIEEKITPRTKAVLPVHLYGNPCRMDRIGGIARARNLSIVEDCAQSLGSRFEEKKTGTFGHFGCFSFYPTKNLGAFGDAGMVTSNDEALAAEVKVLRVHGASKLYHHDKLGVNSRLDEIQAAVLNVKLKFLEEWLELRREKARRYDELLAKAGAEGLVPPSEEKDGYHTYHQYVVRAPRRDELLEHLAAQGIQCRVYYPVPLHLEKALAFLGHKPGDFPEAERASRETLALPIYPELNENDQDYAAEKIRGFYRK